MAEGWTSIAAEKRRILANNIREDGRLEWVCPHGVGHTIGHLRKAEESRESTWIHGCDGCCGPFYQKIKELLG